MAGANAPSDGLAGDDPGEPSTAVPSAGASASMGSARVPLGPNAPSDHAGAGGNAATPEQPAEAGSGTDDPVSLDPTVELAAALTGHWHRPGSGIDCVALCDHYRFSGGAVLNFGIDHNQCSGDMVLSETAGTYTLRGRELELTLQGAGSAHSILMATPVDGVAQRVRRMTIAIAERPATADGPTATFLDAEAFSSSDGQRFTSTRADLFTASDGSTMFAQEVVLHLQLSRSLHGLVPGSPLQVELTADLTQADLHHPEVVHRDQIVLTYDARVREEQGWYRIMPVAFDGQDQAQAFENWQAVYDQAGFGEHPGWAQRLLLLQFFPTQRYRPDNALVLSSTMPEYGYLTRSEHPPHQQVITRSLELGPGQ